ncbi:MAG: hypothetical protein H0X51_02805 [Parachlamydiaceae bacterium]|nr:hypothetical protein [Parachlamydiaceae bacterium]
MFKTPSKQADSTDNDSAYNLVSALKRIDALETSLATEERTRKQLECVIKFLRERADGAKLESTHLQKELQAAQEKVATLTHNFLSAKKELAGVATRKPEAEKDSSAQQEIRDLKKRLAQFQELLSQKEEAQERQQEEIQGKQQNLQHATQEELRELRQQLAEAKKTDQAKEDKAQKQIADLSKQLAQEKQGKDNTLANDYAAAQHEIEKLKQQLAIAQEALSTISQQHGNSSHLSQNEIKELQHHLYAAQEALNEQQRQFVVEQKALDEGLTDLNKKLKQSHDMLNAQREQAQIQQEVAQNEIVQLNKRLSQLTETHSHMEEMFSQYKKTSQNEVNDLKKQVSVSTQQESEAQEEVNALQKQFEHLKQQIATGKHDLEDAHQLTESLKIKLAEQEARANDLSSQLEATKAELLTCQQEKQQLDSALTHLKFAVEDKERDVRLAQQHLAKKMKEVSHFSDKAEELKEQVNDLQRAHTEAQTKIATLQQGVEIQQQHERRIQEQLKETAKNADAQAQKWEAKYFQLHDKWQETETTLNNLKAIEERHNQMQMLLTNLGSIITPMPKQRTQTAIEFTTEQHSTPISQATFPQFSQTPIFKEPHHPLFPTKEPASSKYKQSLFD